MPFDPIPDYNDVRFDERGSPYWITASGKRHYIPPVTAAQYRDNPKLLQWAQSQGVTSENPSGNVPKGGFFTGRGEWDSAQGEYDQPTNWGNIAGLGIGGVIGGLAVPAALGAGGGGAAAAVPAALDTSIGGAAGMSLPGYIPGTLAGTSGTVGTATAGTGIGSKLASAGKDALKDLASPQGAASLAALIAGLAGSRGQNNHTEETRRIQAITEARMRRADPLHQVAVNLAYGRLPVNYRQGTQLNNIPLPE